MPILIPTTQALYQYTVRDIVTEAMQTAGALPIGETPPAEDAEYARVTLRRLLKRWQASEHFEWKEEVVSLSPVIGAAQTMTPRRPIRIRSVNLRQNGTDLPMQPIGRSEYDTLPNKAATGTPTMYFYDRKREDAVLYVWPAFASTSGRTLEITMEQEISDCSDLNDIVDLPGEWWDAAVQALAVQIAKHFSLPFDPTDAALAFDAALSGQQHESLWFGEAT